MTKLSHILIATFGMLALAHCSIALANPGQIDFNRDIRPLLSENCFSCHGPDTKALKADLRLDRRESAFGRGESGQTPIVPGKPDASELVRRITANDQSEKMPPAESNKKLSGQQIELLKRWVNEGAPWTDHWSFSPISMPSIPQPAQSESVVRNPIDGFVLAQLATAGLSHSPEESRPRFIRRASLDLVGLPPSIEDVESFVNDKSDRAFESAIDRLLASQHFGERMALVWLDLARYGDTSGYHNDSLRDMWLWREWVIKAFNSNMPFDQFTIEQIAGDLLPNATVQQRIASGFHRNHMTSDEGGLIDAEYRNLYVVDRVSTTGVTWLGMTVGCAQCHDHKYDPLTTRDFYRLYAFFNNVPENGKDGVRDRNPQPFLRVTSPEQDSQLQNLENDFSQAEKRFQQRNETAKSLREGWEQEIVKLGESFEPVGPMARFPLDENGASAGEFAETVDALVHGDVKFAEGPIGKSLICDGSTGLSYGDRFGFERDQPFSVSVRLKVDAKGGSPLGKIGGSQQNRGWDIAVDNGRPSVRLIHHWPDNCIHVQSADELSADKFSQLAFTYDGSSKAAGVTLYVNGIPVRVSIQKDNLTGTIQTAAPFSIGRSDGQTPFYGQIDEARIYYRVLDNFELAFLGDRQTLKIALTAAKDRRKRDADQLDSFFQQSTAPELAQMQKEVDQKRKSKDEFEKSLPNTMVMSEMESPRETFIKVRGNYDQDGEKVSPGVPAFLPQLATPIDAKRLNRLDLARWLVSREHPLTARVMVNRLWAMLFGTGLVKTLNDFGSQGERPSHPELLDWLAADFMTDWDVKRIVKQMVMSSTYRQRSAATRELLARDGENRVLARGPRQRLDAEMIRDNALSVAGILNPSIGGKSIKPAQPDGTWEINEMSGYKYDKSTGADLYRRGLYVYWRRSTVYPSFVTLDAPTREFCIAQRAKTSTPLQSLVLMNDPVFVEAARAFAQRLISEIPGNSRSRLTHAWRLALARWPSPDELKILENTLDSQMATYNRDKDAAKKLISVGDLALPKDVDESELAAWTAISNVILNLNETISN